MRKTIRISKELKKELNKRKINKKQTYEDVLWDLIFDTRELRPEFIKKMKKREKEGKAKYVRFKSIAELRKEIEGK